MPGTKVFISHSHEEKDLALAWKNGDVRSTVLEICQRLVTEAGLKAAPQYWGGQLQRSAGTP